MSLRALADVAEWDNVSPTEIAVGFHLANCANNETGKCFPSVGYIAKKTSLSERSVSRILSALEEKGRIKRVFNYNKDGKQQASSYIFYPVTHDTLPPDTHDTLHPVTHDTHNQEEVIRKIKKQAKKAWQPPEWINQQAWQEFEQHRRDKRKPLTDLARQKAANALKILDHKQQQDCIDCTIQNSWTGLFPEKHRGTTHEASKRPTAGQSRTARLGDILREKYEEAVAEENGAADIRETADTLQRPVVSTTW